MKNLLSKFIALGLIAFYLATPLATMAQVQPADQRLAQARAQDQIACAEKKTTHLSTQDGTVANMLSNAFKEHLGNFVQDFFSHKLGPMVQQRLNQVMPGLIQSGLRNRLSGYVNDAVSSRYSNTSPTADELRAITEEGIRKITNDIIQSQTPNVTQYFLQHDFPKYLSDSFSDTASSTIADPAFVQKIRDAVDQLDQQMQIAQAQSMLELARYAKNLLDQVKEIPKAAAQGWKNGDPFSAFDEIQSLVDQGKQLQTMASTTANMRLTPEQKDEMVKTIVEEMAKAAAESVANDSSMQTLTDDISKRVTDLLGDKLSSGLTTSFDNLDWSRVVDQHITEASDGVVRIGNFELTGPNGNLTGGLAGDLFNPMVKDMSLPIAQWTGGLVTGVMSSSDWGFIGAAANNPGANIMIQGAGGAWAPGTAADIANGGLNLNAMILNPATNRWEPTSLGVPEMLSPQGGVPQILPADFVGPPAADQTIASLADNAGNNIASQATQQASIKLSASAAFKGLGDAFIGAVPGMVGGLVGSLCANIPVVGGLVAPIASLATTYAVNALLGLSPKALGLLTADIGMQINVGMGFDAVGKEIAEVIKNTGKSNQNETVANAYLESVQATNLQACTYEKSTNRIMLALESIFTIKITDSHKASFLSLRDFLNGPMRKLMSSGYRVASTPGATQNQNGQSLVNDVPQSVAQNTEETKRQTEDQLKNSPNFADQKAGVILARMNAAQTPNTPSQAIYQAMQNPQQTAQMNNKTWWDNFTTLSQPGNTPDSALLLALDKQNQAMSRAEIQTYVDAIANNGIHSLRVCLEWGIGYCKQWTTLTPGSQVGSLFNRLIASPIDYGSAGVYNADALNKPGADMMASIANVSQNPNTNPATQSSLGNDPCPGPNPCPKTGWQEGQISSGSLSNTMTNSVDNAYGTLDALYGGSSGQDQSGAGSTSGGSSFPRVSVSAFQLNPDNTRLSWQTSNAIGCTPGNTWVGTNYTATSTFVDDGSGTGNASITLPAKHPALNYQLTCYGEGSDDQQTVEVNVPAKN